MFKDEGIGAEDFGPPTPTSTQLAVQTVRDIATARVPLEGATLLYIAGGMVAAYLLYNYLYSEA